MGVYTWNIHDVIIVLRVVIFLPLNGRHLAATARANSHASANGSWKARQMVVGMNRVLL
jgi:hypothetical protein